MSLRHPEILDIARREGRVTVDGLAEQLGVTVQTVRRDLADLDAQGQLARVHGGAVLRSGLTNIAYLDRRGLNAQAKARIAAKTAQMIPNEASLFLNIGTTTEAVAAALRHHKELLVVTNNMNVATTLMGNEGCEVVVAGGAMRHSDGGLVGALALRTVEQFALDFAIIGCSALNTNGDVLDFDLDEVAVSQAMLARAKRAFLVADHGKFTRDAPARITSMDRLDTFVTDQSPPDEITSRAHTWPVGITIA